MPALRIATINIRNRKDRWLARRHLLVSQLIDASPDIIGLQEISLSINQGRWLCRQINVRLSGTSHGPYRLVQARRQSVRHFWEAVGVLSRLPILYYDVTALGFGGRVALRANLELPPAAGGRLHQSLDFVSVHLHHVAEDSEARLEQAMQLVGRLNERRRVPVQIVVGDFNELPGGPAIAFMKQIYRSAYAEVYGREPLATFPTNLVQPPIDWSGCLDYVFVSPSVYNVKGASLFCDRPSPEDETLYPSDHVGLIADLEV